ncbi:MAG: hypothetical protein KJZ65_15010 [Phycisphaerales bacterium]|nr:hypothetical protein [Phycisphaerales bacterium]
MMKHRGMYMGVVVALAGLAGSAYAQDSVSNQGASLPGDALSPWDTGLQKTSYVVDMTPFQTSWGTQFGIAPLIKTSKASTSFTSSLGSSQFLSNDMLTGVPYASSQYKLWQNAAGQGINPQTNAATGTITAPAGNSYQFAAAMTEFATSTGGFNYNGLIGAVVNYNPSNSGRLYVTRVVGAVNTTNATSGDSSQLGFGSIDANGNLYYRADAFGIVGSPGLPSVSGNNLYRTDLLSRGSVLNQIIGNPAALNATTALLTASTVSHNTPNHIPQSVAGSAILAGTNFNNEYVRGATAPLTADSSHLAAGVTNHRGGLGSTTAQVLGSGVATFGLLAQTGGPTTSINLFSVNAAGNVIDKGNLTAPASVTDNSDGFTINYTAAAEFRQYVSQTAARGGNGQVALGRDRNGMGLIAATIHENGLNDDFSNQILVARRNPNTGATQWTIAAYIDQAFVSGRSGKEVLDGSGAVIGVLTPLFNVTGGSPLGPSISSPVIDAAGNIWFLSAVELFNRLPGGGSDFDNALFRAVYDEATFSYRLELVLELGSVFAGQNSGRNYQVQFLAIADSNSIDSATVFSGNGTSHTWNNVPLSELTNRDPRTSGGFVLQASIVYDVDADGTYNTAGVDEQYNALLFIGSMINAGPQPCNPADFAEPYGVLNFFDVQAFLQAFSAQNPAADLNNDGLFNFFDVQTFLQAFSAGCP